MSFGFKTKSEKPRKGLTASIHAAIFLSFAISFLQCSPSDPNDTPAIHQRLKQSKHSNQNTSNPNFLMITVDTLRADRLGGFGCPLPISPCLDELSRSALIFPDLRCGIPCTAPSHATFLTGLSPFEHGSLVNGQPIHPDLPTLGRFFQQKGYKTAAVLSSAVLSANLCGLNSGFDAYFDLQKIESTKETPVQNQALSSNNPPFRQPKRIQFAFGETLNGDSGVAHDRKANETTDVAISWLKQNRNSPFFIWIHYFDPHSSYMPPYPYDKVFTEYYASSGDIIEMLALPHRNEWSRKKWRENNAFISQYDGEVRYTDHEIERLLRFFAEKGILSNTIISVISDHGESLGDYFGYVGHGRYLNDASIRIPFFIKLQRSDRSEIVESLINATDVYSITKNIYLNIEAFSNGEKEHRRKIESFLPSMDRRQFFHTSVTSDANEMYSGAYQNNRKVVCKYLFAEKRMHQCSGIDLNRDPEELNFRNGDSAENYSDLEDDLRKWTEKHPPPDRISTDEIKPDDLRALKALGYFQD